MLKKKYIKSQNAKMVLIEEFYQQSLVLDWYSDFFNVLVMLYFINYIYLMFNIQLLKWRLLFFCVRVKRKWLENKFGILYQVINFAIFFRQNDLTRLSALCLNVIFGNMFVHRLVTLTNFLFCRMNANPDVIILSLEFFFFQISPKQL
jgi:hypothetical protein